MVVCFENTVGLTGDWAVGEVAMWESEDGKDGGGRKSLMHTHYPKEVKADPPQRINSWVNVPKNLKAMQW